MTGFVTVTADEAYDTRKCSAVVADRGAAAVIPLRKNAGPWKPMTDGAIVRNEALRACRHFGTASGKRPTGIHAIKRIIPSTKLIVEINFYTTFENFRVCRNMNQKTNDSAELWRLARERSWFNRIRLSEDFVTPGRDDTFTKLANLDALGLPQDLTGKRVLDIGAWDGFFSFEMERRGAEVVALDHVDKEATSFVVASAILGSEVTWKTENIYHLDPEVLGYFDVVLCLGVIYHLRHILLGLDKIRGVMKPGAELFVETASIDRHVLIGDGTFMQFDSAGPVATGPLLQLYAEGELGKDGSNFFAPNAAGLEALLRASEFKMENIQVGPTGHPTRIIARAQAVQSPSVAFHRERDMATLSQRFGITSFKPPEAEVDASQPGKTAKRSLLGFLKGF